MEMLYLKRLVRKRILYEYYPRCKKLKRGADWLDVTNCALSPNGRQNNISDSMCTESEWYLSQRLHLGFKLYEQYKVDCKSYEIRNIEFLTLRPFAQQEILCCPDEVSIKHKFFNLKRDCHNFIICLRALCVSSYQMIVCRQHERLHLHGAVCLWSYSNV